MSVKPPLHDVLTATSTVIELHPDRHYLLVFRGVDMPDDVLNDFARDLARRGISNIVIMLDADASLEVMEVAPPDVAQAQADSESRYLGREA